MKKKYYIVKWYSLISLASGYDYEKENLRAIKCPIEFHSSEIVGTFDYIV